MGASTPKIFNSRATKLGTFEASWPDEVIKQEPMFFNYRADLALEHGGPITKAFLSALENYSIYKLSELVFDSRVHMLMPGWYPCIPGWHHDDVARGDDGQPDYDKLRYTSKHYIGLVNAHIAPTHFAEGKCWMPAVPPGQVIYKVWNDEVERLLADNTLSLREVKSGEVMLFGFDAFHTGTKAVASGWRWFGRATACSDRVKSVTNEVRRQVNVYMDDPTMGW